MKQEISDSALYWALFNCFELRLPGQAILDIAQPGPADEAVAYWTPKVFAQVEADAFPNAPTPEKIRRELKEYGAWDAEELADDEANRQRLVWCAAWNIAEESEPDCSKPVSASAQ